MPFDFLKRFFIDPIVMGTGYNIFNTLAYGAMFIAIGFFVYKVFKTKGIKITNEFWTGILPYVFLGGILRALEDFLEASGFYAPFSGPYLITDPTGTVKNVLLMTPLIYFVVFGIAFLFLGVAKLIERFKDIPYHKTWSVVGVLLCLLFLAPTHFTNPLGMFLILGIFALWAVAFIFVERLTQWWLLSKKNLVLLLAHIFDATTTFVAIQFFAYSEQHVVAGFAIGLLGPISMYLLKIPVVLGVLYLVDTDKKSDKEFKNLIKLAILILGLGPGLRNMLRLGMGV